MFDDDYNQDEFPMNIGACNNIFPDPLGTSGQQIPGHGGSVPWPHEQNQGGTFPPDKQGYWGRPPETAEFAITKEAFRRIATLEAEIQSLQEQSASYVAPRTPAYAKMAQLQRKYALLEEFAHHVMRVDQIRLKGVPLGVRAAEVLEEIEDLDA